MVHPGRGAAGQTVAVTATAALLLALTLAVAAGDWVAVALGNKALEYVCKPLTMVVLIAATLALDPTNATARGCFVVALVLSLAGDVFLMLPDEKLFVFGLGSFLAGHIAYIVGLWVGGVSRAALLVGVLLVLVAVATLGVRIVRGVRNGEHPELTGPVVAYLVVISVMVASAVGRTNAFAIVGAVLFYASDAMIAWTRFIEDKPWGKLAIIVTYHLGQIGLVLSLV